MTIPATNKYEVLFSGQHLRLIRATHANNGSARLFKTVVEGTASSIALRQLTQENEICRDLNVAGVLRPISETTVEGYPAVMFEDPGGNPLSQLLATCPVDLSLFLDVAIELTDIIGLLHRKGIVHKDIHSGNIIVCTDCDPARVYLTGFGIAVALLPGQRAEKVAPNKLEGTLSVISPEQTGRMNRPVDFRTDFYSLGAVLYQMLTGRLPFESNDPLALVHAHLAKEPKAPSIIDTRTPPVLSDLVLKLLSKDANDRYHSATGIKADLKRCRDDWNRNGTISTFGLGLQDVSETFHIPDRLYGRDKQIHSLKAAFDRTCNGPVELVLVTGYAGIGKTELVNQIRGPVFHKNGYFIAGKCDPLHRKIPFAPLVEAISEAVDLALAQPQDEIDQLRNALSQALGSQGRVLTDVVPMLSLIIGEQPPVPELPPDQARNRFHLMLQRLFAAVTIKDRPVALFLDDLQWADYSTLTMLQTLACDRDLRNLLLIGSYRDQEIDETHELPRILKEINEEGGRIQTIPLAPVRTETVSALIADTLEAPPEKIRDLAALCLGKTGGNPFFLKHFLHELVARTLIFFDAGRNRWHWHMDKIATADVTDNVVDLMAGTIAGLDDNVQQALKTAACIGSSFDLGTMCAVMNRPPQALLDALWPAVQSGFISMLAGPGLHFAMGLDRAATKPVTADDAKTEQIRFYFIHDHIHETAYGLMSDKYRMGMHLRLGRLLLEKSKNNKQAEKIFDILGQFNRAAALVTQPEEIENLAELNLEAGQRARSMALFESAFEYFRMGIDLMGEKGWQQQYELTKVLHLKGIEAALVSGRYLELDRWYETAVHHIRTPVEASDAYLVKIQKEIGVANFSQAIDLGLEILDKLGINLSMDISATDVQVEQEKTEKLLSGVTVDDILSLPQIEDPRHLAALAIMPAVEIPTFFVNRELAKLLSLKRIGLQLHHGNSEYSAYNCIAYAFFLMAYPERIADAHVYGQLAIQFLDRYENSIYDNETKHLYYTGILPFSEHPRNILEPLKAIYHACIETGNFRQAGVSLFFIDLFPFFTGNPLESVDAKMAECSKTVMKLQNIYLATTLAPHHQMVLNLMGRSQHSLTLIGDAFDESIHLPQLKKESNHTLLVAIYFCKLILACVFERFQDAVELVEKIERQSYYIPNIAPYQSRCSFYGAFARLAISETNANQQDSAQLEKVVFHQQQLQLNADAAPMNCLHLLHLIKAEQARVEGRLFDAQEHFDRAIELAEENGYLQDQALANERTARFWMDRTKNTIAQAYMQQAIECYSRWGASAKVRDLQEKHPDFFIKPGTEAAAAAEQMPQQLATDLDVMSALRASRAISGEIRLDRLVEKLMAVVIENAGATCSRLLLKTDGHFYVAAEADAEQPGQVNHSDKALTVDQAEHLLPLQIIQYVQRTGKPVVIEDAPAHERFGQDPYIVKNHPRSVLCSPIVHKENLIGLFYLENKLATDTFTDDRLKMLEILSAQIAVSLENANLYESRRRAELELKKHRDHLEELVIERTNELEMTNKELAVAKEQAEAANASKSDFLARMSHEIRTPLSAVTGLTNIVLKTNLTLDQRDYLNKVQIASRNLSDVIKDILDFSKIEAGRLDLTPVPFDLDQVMEQLADLFSNRVTQKDLKLFFSVAPQVPRQLTGDAGRLNQVLTNLIGNSIKFTEKGEIVVGVNIEDAIPNYQSHVALQFSITDTGIGIDADVLPTLFDPFTQADGSLTRKHEGTGLGLAICQQLVQLFGGRIWAESTPGKGSTFCFTAMLELRTKPETVEQRQPEDLTATAIQQLAGQRVLVVEDSELNLLVAEVLLEQMGLTIEAAENGQVAVDKFTSSEPGYYDAVLMDIQMPIMNGYEATKKIRAWEADSQITDHQIPIIALTAHAMKGEREKCLAANMDDYLAKPLDEHDLKQMLFKWLTTISKKED